MTVCPLCLGLCVQLAGDAAGVTCARCRGDGLEPQEKLIVGELYKTRGGRLVMVSARKETALKSLTLGTPLPRIEFVGIFMDDYTSTVWNQDGSYIRAGHFDPRDLIVT